LLDAGGGTGVEEAGDTDVEGWTIGVWTEVDVRTVELDDTVGVKVAAVALVEEDGVTTVVKVDPILFENGGVELTAVDIDEGTELGKKLEEDAVRVTRFAQT